MNKNNMLKDKKLFLLDDDKIFVLGTKSFIEELRRFNINVT